MAGILRFLFFALLVRGLMLVILGLNVRHRERLPTTGPAVLVANHNSHLDTMALVTLLPLRSLPHVRPVAAMDYFLKSRWLAWFALNIVGILPVERVSSGRHADPLSGCSEALGRGDVLIFYPEGTRGEPERLSQFKTGIARVAERHPEVPVYPVFMHGYGKALPKGEALLVPFFCDVYVGEPLAWTGDRRSYMAKLEARLQALAGEGKLPAWE